MTWNVAMYALGWASLITMAGISLAMIADALIPNWARIIAALRGNTVRGFVPLSPIASVLPLRTSLPPLRAVEADAQPTHSERAA